MGNLPDRTQPVRPDFSGKELANIIQKNKNTQFIIDGASCYTGGMSSAIGNLSSSDAERVTAFFDTDPYAL